MVFKKLQIFTTNINQKIKGVNAENRPYFFNSMTNIKTFDLNLSIMNKISFEKNADWVIYEIRTFKNLDKENSLYLIFNNADAYTEYNPTEDDSKTKFFVFPFTNKNREALENYTELWDKIKNQIETVNGDNPIEYGKDFMKARFESNDELPLSKILNVPVHIIIVKSVFQEESNYYPQVLLHECQCKHED